MKDLRRFYIEGGTYFFTVVTADRKPFLCLPESRDALRKSISHVRSRYPFDIQAWVLLPDHLHCIWTMPQDDADFSLRWRLIKKNYSHMMKGRVATTRSASKQNKRELGIWQRRFWEHCIRSEDDFMRHFDYVHFNPIKHGHAKTAAGWEWSTFHRYVQQGYYEQDRDTPLSDYLIHDDIGHE